MSTIDIRTIPNDKVTAIRFAEPEGVFDDSSITYTQADVVVKGTAGSQWQVSIDETDSDNYVRVLNKEHALNLIKGLHKAIDLGWIK